MDSHSTGLIAAKGRVAISFQLNQQSVASVSSDSRVPKGSEMRGDGRCGDMGRGPGGTEAVRGARRPRPSVAS